MVFKQNLVVQKFVLDAYVTHVQYIVAFQHLLATGKRRHAGDVSEGNQPRQAGQGAGAASVCYCGGHIKILTHLYTHKRLLRILLHKWNDI